ncbi:MAG: lipoprotein signal peptidase [Muribaculaceae bacterium]|nr:lipoprotein signal peptidase [Muribaculaceae bacterium]
MSRNDIQPLQDGRAARLGWLVAAIVTLVIVADQWLKIWVKTHFWLGEDLELTSWFHLRFIENNGFAFGLEWFNKYVLTFGRILAVVFFCWCMNRLLRMGTGQRTGFIVAFALIIAGAAGNIFDCVFYGEIFNNPMPPQVATLFPTGEGYASWFEGKVVDMLYFPLFSFTWPGWIPGIGGKEFEFFQYIFNIADAAISVGVLLMLFFYSADASRAFATLFGGHEAEASSKASGRRDGTK